MAKSKVYHLVSWHLRLRDAAAYDRYDLDNIERQYMPLKDSRAMKQSLINGLKAGMTVRIVNIPREG